MSTVELRNKVQEIISQANDEFLKKILAMSESEVYEIPEFHIALVRERIAKYNDDFSKYNSLDELETKINFD